MYLSGRNTFINIKKKLKNVSYLIQVVILQIWVELFLMAPLAISRNFWRAFVPHRVHVETKQYDEGRSPVSLL